MQRSPRQAVTSSPASYRHVAPRSPSLRTPLPDKDVTDATIEDAFVSFILHCNPGVPQGIDTTALREAFKVPPKSGGKSFDTFTLFELIKQLETKELKTWAELALKLGVEPPDQEKGESSQKIQQYAVRLKRWMHSMHVDAFFEFLMDRPHPYWTDVPSDLNPINENGRDGVAAEDDMALRALLPHIKPRRGRKKPEDGPSPMGDDLNSARPDTMDPWTAHPDGRGSAFLFPPPPDTLGLSTPVAPHSSLPWAGGDIVQTPLSAYPHSAITPASRNAFWGDNPGSEPRSAITPQKLRLAGKRHGAKVVSSAWKPGGATSSGKTRGRPRINRGNQDGPFSAFPTSETPSFKIPPPILETSGSLHNTPSSTPTRPVTSPIALTPAPTSGAPLQSPATAAPLQSPRSVPQVTHIPPPVPPNRSLSQPSAVSADAPSGRPAKRSRLSLQVPARVGGEVRLATPPPPVVMVNGETSQATNQSQEIPNGPDQNFYTGMPHEMGGIFPVGPPGPTFGTSLEQQPMTGQVEFEDPTDRTNVDNVASHFVYTILNAHWFDAKGASIPACGADEAWAINDTVMENLRKAATSKEAFLINLAALTGGAMLLAAPIVIRRLEELEDRTRYAVSWELRLGDIRGSYSMQETVLHERWKKSEKEDRSATEGAEDGGNGNGDGDGAEGEPSAEEWQRKYQDIVGLLRKRDEQLSDLRLKVMSSLRDGSQRGG